MGNYCYRTNFVVGAENMMNKKAMLARDFIIILVLFGAVTGISALIVIDMAGENTGYDIENMTNEKFQENYNTLTETSTTIYKMQDATMSKEGTSVLSPYTTTIQALISVISLIFGSVNVAGNTMANFAEDFGVPSAISNIFFPMMLVIVIVIIVFVIISSVSKGRM